MSDDRELRGMLEQLQMELRQIEARLKETGRHSRDYYEALHTLVSELTAKRDALLRERDGARMEIAQLGQPPSRTVSGRIRHAATAALSRLAIGIAFLAPFVGAAAFLWRSLLGHTVDPRRFLVAGGFAAIGAVGMWWAAIHGPITRNIR